jgi:hypothetical protein
MRPETLTIPPIIAAAAISLAQFCNGFVSHQMDGPVVAMTGLKDLDPRRNDTELVRTIERQQA